MRKAAVVPALLTLLIPHVAMAQGAASPRPLQMRVTASSTYDDNIFSRPVGIADFIWRLTPEVTARRRSTKLTLLGSYSFDAERFRDHVELSTSAARQTGTLEATIRPTPFTTLVVDGGYTRTSTAADLNLATTGLSTDRQRAQEWRGGVDVRRLLGPQTALHLGYKRSDQVMAEGPTVETHAVEVWLNRRLSARDETFVRYAGRRFVFDIGNAIPSDTAVVGWKRQVSSTVSVDLEGGPQLSGPSNRPEMVASIGHHQGSRTTSMSYAITQATALGVTEVIALQRAQWELVDRPGPGRELALRGALFVNTAGASVVRSARLSATMTRPITDTLAFSVEYVGVLQHGELSALPQPDARLGRNVVSVRLIAFAGSSR